MEEKIISFIIRAEKGFFKKPDINEGMYLTFNMLHKPALLGILGAIIGLKGYQKNSEFPEYYNKLKDLMIGIKPVGDEKGNFKKTVITYTNTTGFANEEKGGNLIITEQTLIKPSYKIFLKLDLDKEIEKKIYDNIKNQQSVYIPYMGKNDYTLWWDKDEVKEYENFEKIESIDESIVIDSIFIKKDLLRNIRESQEEEFELFDFSSIHEEAKFSYFERLPINFNKKLYQYNYSDFVYTNINIKAGVQIENLYQIDNEKYVQLF